MQYAATLINYMRRRRLPTNNTFYILKCQLIQVHLNPINRHCSCNIVLMNLSQFTEDVNNNNQLLHRHSETEMELPNSKDRLGNHRKRHRLTWVSHILHEVISRHLVENFVWRTFNHG